MSRPALTAAGVLLTLAGYLQGCGHPVEIVNVSLMNTETYQYVIALGDEDGASISTQARHYTISEIRRDVRTNWVATYMYQPVVAFVGADNAEIEMLTGSDGASARTNKKRVAFHFEIHD